MTDIEKILNNLDPLQREAICKMLEKIALARNNRWTGILIFNFHLNSGGISDASMEQREKIITNKTRRFRSKGIDNE